VAALIVTACGERTIFELPHWMVISWEASMIAPSIQRAPPSETRGERLLSLQLTSAIYDGALTVEFALHNTLDVDIFVDQSGPTRNWPPDRRGYVHVHREDRRGLALSLNRRRSPIIEHASHCHGRRHRR
jgi:hypothetical protein